MKRLLYIVFITSLVMLICSSGFSQDKKVKVYKAAVTTYTSIESYSGFIKEVQDSSITIISDEGLVTIIPSTSVKRIKIWHAGNSGHAALSGALAGAALGTLIFLSDTEDPYASIAIPVFAGIGAIIGGLGGAASNNENIKINGDQQIFKENAVVMRKYIQSSSEKNQGIIK